MNEIISDALFDFRTCAEEAPEGSHDLAAKLNEIIEHSCKQLSADLRAIGLKAEHFDRMWYVEATIYDYVKTSNLDNQVFASAEAFGRALNDPTQRTAAIEHARVQALAVEDQS